MFKSHFTGVRNNEYLDVVCRNGKSIKNTRGCCLVTNTQETNMEIKCFINQAQSVLEQQNENKPPQKSTFRLV